MKRILTISAVFLLIASMAFAAPFRSTVNVKSATDDTVQFLVGSTTTICTKSLKVTDIKNDEETGILYKAISTGTIDVTLEMQQSYRAAEVEGTCVDAEYLTTDLIETSIADGLWSLATIDTVILPYIRFRITGNGSNDQGTLFEIKVSK